MVRPFEEEGVSGYLHWPEEPAAHGLVLAHGAGSNCNAPLLMRIANELVLQQWAVLRINLPFRRMRPGGPPRPGDAAADRAGLAAALDVLAKHCSMRAFLGGHSYGGRQASMLAAEHPGITEALLLLSYPLHPPGKPEQLRTAHFPALATAAMFVHGTRDPFGTIEEVDQARSSIRGRTDLYIVDGAAHDLRGGRDISFVSRWIGFAKGLGA
jgi:hypothetical protein